MSEKYKVRDQEGIYFVTFAVVEWIDVFTRPIYKDLFCLASGQGTEVTSALEGDPGCLYLQ